jgi:DNA invertase Pin-like site-specific DNA recombinase
MTTKKAIRFFRVSSKKQEDGYSLEAQEKESLHHEGRHDLEAVRTWAVSESAKTSEVRKAFKEMVEFVRKNPSVTVMLFEKPDRMTRNFRDLVTIYDLIEKHGKEIHFFRTGLKINRESKSSDQIQLDIQVVLARNFINNLREEVMKGMKMKVENGGFPGTARIGYLNNKATAELEVDPVQGPIVKKLWEMLATGNCTVPQIEKIAHEMGLRYRNNPKPVSRAALYAMFRSPIYYGVVRWNGQEKPGTHEPLITKDVFDRVQAILGQEKCPKSLKFAFRGLPTCGTCGGFITAERHVKFTGGRKKEYVYYRCTGWKNGGSVCADTYIREEDLVQQLGLALKDLKFDPRTLADLQAALKKSYAAEREYAGERSGALRAEEARLKNRIDQVYNDKLDGVITAEEYAEKVHAWRERLAKVRAELGGLDGAHDLYLNEASRILDLAQRAYDVYMAQTDNFERRKLLDDLVSKVVIRDKMALSNLKEPFQTLVRVASAANSGEGDPGWYAQEE